MNKFITKIDKKISEKNIRIPFKGSIELTNSCNFACIHCFVNHQKDFLDKKEIFKSIDYLVNYGCLFIQLTGGECLLHEDFNEIYEYIVKKGILITIMTNGSLISSKTLNLFRKFPPYKIVVSLYGASNVVYEKVTGKKNQFTKVHSNLIELKSLGLNLHMNIILLEVNKCELSMMEEISKNITEYYFVYNKLLNKKKSDSNISNSASLTSAEIKIITRIRQHYQAIIKKNFEENHYETNDEKDYFYCNAGVTSFHITPLNELALCQLQNRNFISLKKEKFDDAWQELQRIRLLELRIEEECKSCKINMYCKSCPIKVRTMTKEDRYICKEVKNSLNQVKNL